MTLLDIFLVSYPLAEQQKSPESLGYLSGCLGGTLYQLSHKNSLSPKLFFAMANTK
jgi:hypothetical protein